MSDDQPQRDTNGMATVTTVTGSSGNAKRGLIFVLVLAALLGGMYAYAKYGHSHPKKVKIVNVSAAAVKYRGEYLTPINTVSLLIRADATRNTAVAKQLVCAPDHAAIPNLAQNADVTSFAIDANTEPDAHHASVAVTLHLTGKKAGQQIKFPLVRQTHLWKVCFAGHQ